MRKLLQALPILVAVLACSASATQAASVRTLRPRLLSTQADWVGRVDARTLAYGRAAVGASAEVVSDGNGTVRAVAAPEGCGPRAAGSGHLLFTCVLGSTTTTTTRRAVVTAPDGTVQRSLDYTFESQPPDGYGPGGADAIGSQWLHHSTGCLYCDIGSVDLNWHTGELRRPDLRTLTGYQDLDAPEAVSPLCAPLQQSPTPADDRGGLPSQALGVQVSGQWVLQRVMDETPDGGVTTAWRLRHCGTTKVYKMPAGTSPVALAAGYVVLIRKADDGVELLRLRDRRRFRLAGVVRPRGDDPQVAATRHRLLVRGDARSQALLWSIMLPQK